MLLYVTVCQRHCQMPQWYNVALSLSRSLSHHLPIFLISISDHFSLSLVFSLFLSECFCLCLCICLCRCLSPPLSLSLSPLGHTSLCNHGYIGALLFVDSSTRINRALTSFGSGALRSRSSSLIPSAYSCSITSFMVGTSDVRATLHVML